MRSGCPSETGFPRGTLLLVTAETVHEPADPPLGGPRRIGRMGEREFTVMVAMTMALTALAIDSILPAFGAIRQDFGLAADSTAAAQIVTFFFLGLASGQWIYGPMADHFGRKAVLYTGMTIYALGAVFSALAPTLGWVLVGRFIWGLGGAGTRVVALAIVRDVYEGDRMARTMSFIMSIFIIVPVLAPGIGSLIISVFPWQGVFWFCALLVVLLALWSRRLPETSDPALRIELRFTPVLAAARQVVGNRITMGYTIAATLLFGSFLSYLASSELIVEDIYDRASLFPLIFGANAALMGLATFSNASVVRRFGAHRVTHVAMVAYPLVALGFVILGRSTDGAPVLPALMAILALLLGLNAILMPNMNSIAMEPMGDVAGMASAVIGTVSMAGGALLGSALDRAFDGTVNPLASGFLALSLAALGVLAWAERWRLAIFAGRGANIPLEVVEDGRGVPS